MQVQSGGDHRGGTDDLAHAGSYPSFYVGQSLHVRCPVQVQ